MKCHYIDDKKVGKILIPGCMGTAAMGIRNCTCNTSTPQTFKEFERERYNEMIRQKNQIIKSQEKEIISLNRTLRKLLKSQKP